MSHRNVGGPDRAVRLALGVILLPTGLFLLREDHGQGLVVTILGLVGLVTGITGFCLLYAPFSFSTARPRASQATSSRRGKPLPLENHLKQGPSRVDGG